MKLPYNAEKCFEIEDADRPWRVVHTKARREKRLAEDCVDMNVPCFLPLREHKTRKNGKTIYKIKKTRR